MAHAATRRALLSRPAAASGVSVLSAAAIAAMVSWWKLDETSGTRYDSHGSNDLTDNNTVGYDTGLVQGNCATFNGTNESLSRADDGTFDIGANDFCIVAWVNSVALGTYERIISKHLNEDKSWVLQTNTGAGFDFEVRNSTNAAWVLATKSASVATTYMIVAYYDYTASEIGISLNGGAFATTAYGGGSVPGTAEPLRFGTDGSGQWWDGSLDEVAIFKGAIPSSDDIAALYNSGAGITYEQAVGA